MIMQKLIEAVLPMSGGNFYSVKFADGTDCIAPADKEYNAPLDSGVEAWMVVEQRESKGREFELLTFWGPKEAYEMQNAKPVNLSVAAQEPLTIKEPPPKPKRMYVAERELSIMTQVAFKEACEVARVKGAMSKSGVETPAKTIKRMREYLEGMLDVMTEVQA